MLIESLAQKTKLALMTVLATIGGCAVICGFTVWCCISLVTKERDRSTYWTVTFPSWHSVPSWKRTSRWKPRRISNSSISTSSTCLPTTTTSSGRSARRCTWQTVPPSSRNRRWMRTDSIRISFPLRRCVPSCVTPSISTNTNGSSPTTGHSSSSAVPRT